MLSLAQLSPSLFCHIFLVHVCFPSLQLTLLFLSFILSRIAVEDSQTGILYYAKLCTGGDWWWSKIVRQQQSLVNKQFKAMKISHFIAMFIRQLFECHTFLVFEFLFTIFKWLVATLGSILDSQLSWESGKFQLARWSHRVALFSDWDHPPTHC